MGAGCHLWAVVGGGGWPWFVYWGWQPFLCVGCHLCLFWGVYIEWLSLMVVCWHQHGGRAVVGHHWGHCWCGGSGGGGGGGG